MSKQNVLVTSDQKKGRDAVNKFRAAYDEARLTQEEAQRLNEAKGWKDYLSAGILRFSSDKHPAAEGVERFYAEVLGVKIDLTGTTFPERPSFSVYMAVVPGLSEDMVMSKITRHFSVNTYSYMSPISANINRSREQSRPSGLYVFAHVGGDEPDTEYLNKSYDDATDENMIFASPLEYLLMTSFHMWKHKKWMDQKGWTRTSSLWSDGGLVMGCFHPDDQDLCLAHGHRGYRSADDGPRELFLG